MIKGMYIMKKIKLTALICVISIIFGGLGVFAEEKCGENINWSYKNGVLSLTGTGRMEDYTKSSPAPWGKHADEIVEVNISNGIKNIGSWSFAKCEKLKKLSIPKSVTDIGQRAFYACSALERIALPEGVVNLGSGAFNSCTGVKAVILPDSLVTIGESAFMNLPLIETITIPKNVMSIGRWALYGNTKLKGMFFEGMPPQLVGEQMLYSIDAGFKIFCPFDYKNEWQDNEFISTQNMYLYAEDRKIPVYVNGKELFFDQQPAILKSKTMVPIRAILTELGAKIEWHDETDTVIAKKGDKTLMITIGSDIMYVNNVPKSIDTPAQILSGVTLVPLRVISESFGAKVQWDDKTKSVEIFTK